MHDEKLTTYYKMNKNLTYKKPLLTEPLIRLYNRLKNKRISVSKLTNAELSSLSYLLAHGLIKFDRTRKGNVSKFLVINS